MTRAFGLLSALWLVSPGAARADEVDDLVARGNDLARNHDYPQAIEKFKAAERARPRTQNVCMIGLAYLRRQRAAQAEVYFARCRSHATAADPAPEWLADAEAAVAAQIANDGLPAIDIRVAAAGAEIRLSSFALDEVLAPQIVHLAPGAHTITASAVGFATVVKEIAVVARTDQKIEIELVPDRPVVVAPVVERHVEPPESIVLPRPPPPPPVERTHGARELLVIGTGAAAGAVVLHVLAFRTRDALANPTSAASYHSNEGTFDAERVGAISLYAVAAVTTGIGLYLRLSHHDSSPQFGAMYTGSAGLVTIGWTR